jgi:hypothetical protein
LIHSLSSEIEEKRKGRLTNNAKSSFLVDKRLEISNLDLIRDMVNIMNLDKVLAEKREDLSL